MGPGSGDGVPREADMSSVFRPPVTATEVGNFFVGQYYQVLQEKPGYAHQFYTDASTKMFVDGSIVHRVTAMQQIHSLIISLNFTSVEIKTAHSLASWDDGVLVMVSGSLQPKGFSEKRNFVQTFFLAPQENGYFVLNDIFHFVNEEELYHQSEVLYSHENDTAHQTVSSFLREPVEEYMLRDHIQDGEYISETHEAAEKHVSQPQHHICEADNITAVKIEGHSAFPISISTGHHCNTDKDSVSKPIKQTYASILQVKFFYHIRSPPKHSVSFNTPLNLECSVAQDCNSVDDHNAHFDAPKQTNTEAVTEVSALDNEDEMTSVYVKNLPSSVSAAELELIFKTFGAIKPCGINIRSKKEAGIFYAFVDFEETYGVHNAVKASPVHFNGRLIYVEERRNNGGLSRGRRGRGRGGNSLERSRNRCSAQRPIRANGLEKREVGSSMKTSRGNSFHQSLIPDHERGILGPKVNGHSHLHRWEVSD